MKMTKCYLIPTIFSVFLSVPVLGQTELSPPEDGPYPLIGRAEPTLAQTGPLSVVIVPLAADPNQDALDVKKLKTEVERELTKAGIQVSVAGQGVTHKLPISTDLKIQIETLRLQDSQRCVLRVQTSLARAVRLAPQGSFYFKADVWNTPPAIQAVPDKSMPLKVTRVAMEQVEAFVVAWHAANPAGAQSARPGDISKSDQRQARRPIESQAVKSAFVASKNSQVFHKSTCRAVKRISPANLIRYNSRDEAVADGKRPCRICKP